MFPSACKISVVLANANIVGLAMLLVATASQSSAFSGTCFSDLDCKEHPFAITKVGLVLDSCQSFKGQQSTVIHQDDRCRDQGVRVAPSQCGRLGRPLAPIAIACVS